MRGTIVSVVLSAAVLTGCYTTGRVGYSASYSGYVSTPDLVTISPGVQVVADYDEPVFYTDGFYWRFDSGHWYRSSNYATGWYYYERPPVAVMRIDRPYAYARYRPSGYVVRNHRYRPPERIVRDHRTTVYRPEPVVRGRVEVRDNPRPTPVVREDRRVERRDDRQDRRIERRDDRRDDRRDRRVERR